MNKVRREAIAVQAALIDNIINQLADIRSELESLREEEQEYFDNMPESFQSGDKGTTAEYAIAALDMAIEHIESFESSGIESELGTAQE